MSSTQTGFSNQEKGINGKDQDTSTGLGSFGSGGATKAEQHTEGVVARTIEEQTAKLPSDTFLWAAVGAMGASAIADRGKRRFELVEFQRQRDHVVRPGPDQLAHQ